MKNVNFNLNQNKTEIAQNKVKQKLDEFLKFKSFSIITDRTESKEQVLQKIIDKFYAGKKLSSKEMAILKELAPEIYIKAVKIMGERKRVEERLKAADSKEKVQKIIDETMGMLSRDDPDYVLKYNHFKEAIKEFKKSTKYANLPETKDDDEFLEALSHHIKTQQDSVEEIDNGYNRNMQHTDQKLRESKKNINRKV